MQTSHKSLYIKHLIRICFQKYSQVLHHLTTYSNINSCHITFLFYFILNFTCLSSNLFRIFELMMCFLYPPSIYHKHIKVYETNSQTMAS